MGVHERRKMSEQNEQVAEVLDLVEKAQSKGTFKLENVIKNVGYPEDSVEVYLDSESAYKLAKLNDELISTLDPEKLSVIEAQVEELKENILKSKLTFKMRGIDQKQIELLEKQSQEKHKDSKEEDAWMVHYMCALVASNVISVEDHEGNIDNSVFTAEDAIGWRETMPAEAWAALMTTMQKLTLAVGYFKGLTDAGFLPKS
jgi:hypothetical protein